jgi:predicted outer membrane protein
MLHRKGALPAGLLSLALLQCGGSTQEKTTYTRGGASTPHARGQPSEELQPASRNAGDEEIAGITDALNAGFIEQARIASGRAIDQRVKDFAAKVMERRSRTLTEQSRWETEQSIVATRGPTAEDISADNARWNARLLAEGPETFAAVYLGQQIAAHDEALRMVDERLLPRAQDPELHMMLETYRDELETDLEAARSLQTALGVSGLEKSPF